MYQEPGNVATLFLIIRKDVFLETEGLVPSK